MDRVIFRRNYDPYMRINKYYAVFPNDEANPGRIAYISFYFVGEKVVFEPYGEMVFRYYYDDTQIIHKDSDEAKKCLKAIQDYFGSDLDFRVVEKIPGGG